MGLGNKKRSTIRRLSRIQLNKAAQTYRVNIAADALRELDLYFVGVVNQPREDGSYPTYEQVIKFIQTDLGKLFGELVSEGSIEGGGHVGTNNLPVIREHAHKRRPRCCFLSF